MHFASSLRSLFSVPTDNPELARSQLAAFSKQIPLLYFILLANSIAVSATHFDTAPVYLTVHAPALLSIVCLIRLIAWHRTRWTEINGADAVRRLRTTTRLVAILGVSFTLWALSLYRYGDAYAQGHVAFYMAITVIGCIFCLMHLRPAALLLTLIVTIPFTVFFALTGNMVFVAISLNILLVAMAMVFILFTYYRDFANLIESKKELVVKQAETQRLSDDNFRLANLDSLTDLPNRRRFFADLHALLHRAQDTDARFAVGLIDLDGFKPVNDLYGHSTGDRVLKEAGRRLRQRCGATVTVARLGGDEFGLIVDGDLTEADIRALGRALCEALAAPYVMSDVTAQISGSVGFATFPEAGRSSEHLFERADYALYYAKQNLRGSTVIFSSEHETELREFGLIEQGLRHADLERELSLVFQPIFALDSMRTVGFEALARWSSPTLGPVAPTAFIKAAERSDLISRLTEVLLRKALHAAGSWPEDVRISFNLSVRDIASPDAILRIMALVERSGIAPDRIDLEVTETAVMRDFEQASEALRCLKQLGVHISLDDFGTGYSSLSCVHRLPLDKIKIDRSFIAEIDTRQTCRDIVRTVVDLCRNLKLACVVEGAETEAQLRILDDLGCNCIQGYYFGLPMPAADVPGHLARERESLLKGVPASLRATRGGFARASVSAAGAA
jgi:diguanylate cyclase (GGDEF)-like protein